MASGILVALLVLGAAATVSAQGLGIQTVGGTDTIRQVRRYALLPTLLLYCIPGAQGLCTLEAGALWEQAFSGQRGRPWDACNRCWHSGRSRWHLGLGEELRRSEEAGKGTGGEEGGDMRGTRERKIQGRGGVRGERRRAGGDV